MRTMSNGIILCVAVLSLLTVVGCSKKADENKPAGGSAKIEAEAATVDTQKPVSEIQAEAETLSVEDLKAVAIKYKDAILAKKADVEELAAKVKEIPVTEVLGEEARALQSELKDVESAVTALTERFQVYYNALKEKGADLAGLEL